MALHGVHPLWPQFCSVTTTTLCPAGPGTARPAGQKPPGRWSAARSQSMLPLLHQQQRAGGRPSPCNRAAAMRVARAGLCYCAARAFLPARQDGAARRTRCRPSVSAYRPGSVARSRGTSAPCLPAPSRRRPTGASHGGGPSAAMAIKRHHQHVPGRSHNLRLLLVRARPLDLQPERQNSSRPSAAPALLVAQHAAPLGRASTTSAITKRSQMIRSASRCGVESSFIAGKVRAPATTRRWPAGPSGPSVQCASDKFPNTQRKPAGHWLPGRPFAVARMLVRGWSTW